jgi:hypothetical protein
VTVRTVVVDPDGSEAPWMYVIVEAPTGVRYVSQSGGSACLQNVCEGYLVPVRSHPDDRGDDLSSDPALLALRAVFEEEMGGVGRSGYELDDRLLKGIRAAVTAIRFWPADDRPPKNLVLDETRLDVLDEAWVPVRPRMAKPS